MRIKSVLNGNFSIGAEFGVKGLLQKLSNKFGFELGSGKINWDGDYTIECSVEMTATELETMSKLQNETYEVTIKNLQHDCAEFCKAVDASAKSFVNTVYDVMDLSDERDDARNKKRADKLKTE